MKNIITLGGLALALILAAAPGVSNAQATRTWVSGVGDDANPCSRTAPCKTFAGAISKTAAGGEINTLDPGGFGAVTITKSITIGTDPSMGGILGALSNGVVINAASTDVINLRGLVISSPTVGASTGLNGVRVLAAGVVNIEDSYIYGNRAATPNGNGILVANSAGIVKLNVINTVVSENGQAATGGGVVIFPTGTGGVVASLNRVQAIDNTFGIRINAASTTGAVVATVNNSVVSNNTQLGVSTNSGGSQALLLVNDTLLSSNLAGVNATGAGAVALINRNTAFGNGTGLQTASGGQIVSFSNNAVASNGVDGVPNSTVLPK